MIRLLLSLYPRTWRERYGEELADLIDDTGLTPRVALDVLRGAAVERATTARLALAGGGTMVIGPAWRHPQVWAVAALLVLAPTLAFVLLSILAYQLGATGLIALMEPVTRWMQSVRVVDLVLVVSPVIALFVAMAPLIRLELRSADSGREAVVGLRLKGLNVAVGLLALLIGGLLLGHIVFESVLQVGA
jgi:hypothetical protein